LTHRILLSPSLSLKRKKWMMRIAMTSRIRLAATDRDLWWM
jgi:hypothetical protein